MTADQLFNVANLIALFAWAALILFPRLRIVTHTVTPVVIPALLAAAYIVILFRYFDPANFFSFSSLSGLASLQNSPWLLLAGWLHYLAFDLFIGTWQVRTAQAENIPHLAVIPCLLMTFMFGPAGLVLFLFVRYILRRKLSLFAA